MGRFDVAARLVDGRAAVERTQDYVWACHVLGYQHPDLTAHGSQVRDWYDSEDGLDLGALDDDCAKLRAAAHASEQALAMQRAELAELAAAWTGTGADAATELLQRHCDSGNEVTAGVYAAAKRCTALRDDLWQVLDAKAAAAMDIDDRRQAERPAWLAAAQSVKGGTDEQSAQDLVEQQIKPYVDNDIRTDWLTAMRSASASVDAVFDTVIDALAAIPPVCFETPGDLGGRLPVGEPVVPMPSPPGEPAAGAPAPPANTMPAAAMTPLPPMPATMPADLFDGLPPVPPLSGLASPMGDGSTGMSAGTGNLGGLGGLAGSVGGIVGNIVDGIGGLIASLTDGLGEAADTSLRGDPLDDASTMADGPDDGEPADQDAEPDDADEDDAAGDDTPADEPSENPLPTADLEDPPGQPTAPPTAPPPVAPAPGPAPPAEPPPAVPPESTPDASTPCEIAADELPQAGQ